MVVVFLLIVLVLRVVLVFYMLLLCVLSCFLLCLFFSLFPKERLLKHVFPLLCFWCLLFYVVVALFVFLFGCVFVVL